MSAAPHNSAAAWCLAAAVVFCSTPIAVVLHHPVMKAAVSTDRPCNWLEIQLLDSVLLIGTVADRHL